MLQFVCKSFAQLSTQELYLLLHMRQEVFAVEQQIVYQDCDGKDEQSLHLLAYDTNNNCVAYARLLPIGLSYPAYCSIGRVLVMQAYRKFNFGKLLMQEAIAACKQNFGGPIKISAQQYLERFYNELGFETVSEPYIEEDILHIGMLYK
jgi:ElaA protein